MQYYIFQEVFFMELSLEVCLKTTLSHMSSRSEGRESSRHFNVPAKFCVRTVECQCLLTSEPVSSYLLNSPAVEMMQFILFQKFWAYTAWDLKVKLSRAIVDKSHWWALGLWTQSGTIWKSGVQGVKKSPGEVGSVMSVLRNSLIVDVVENSGSFLLFIDNGDFFGIFIVVLHHQFWRNVNSCSSLLVVNTVHSLECCFRTPFNFK